MNATVENDKGITTVLTHQATIDDVVRTDVAPGYAVIAAGPVPPAPTELLEQSEQRNTTLQSGQREDLYTLPLHD